MATFKKGPNGAFSGKVGSVVGSSWRGIDYIRGLPSKRKSAPTEAEAGNRTKFGFTQSWLNYFAPFISIGYMNYSRTMTANNAALSWNFRNAVEGTAPDFQINYASVLLSDGPLQQAINPSALVADGKIKITWEVVLRRKAKVSDELMLIAFCPELQHSVFSIGDALRSDKCYELELPQIFSTKSIEVFIAFCSMDRKIASRTQYMGNFIFS